MHKGENLAEAINSIVKSKSKSKINATVSYKGSNFVRLFKYQNSDLTFNFNETDDAVQKSFETEDIHETILTLWDIDKTFDEFPEGIVFDNPISILNSNKNQGSDIGDSGDDNQLKLNSIVYYSAAILNVSKLSAWINRTLSSEYVKKSFKTLLDALFMKREQNTTKDAEKRRENLIYAAYMKSASVENLTITDGLDLNVDVTAEVELYFQTTKNLNLETISTKQFWLTHQTSLPILSTLAVKLLNIPSTTACIERYFSICGIICNKGNNTKSPTKSKSYSSWFICKQLIKYIFLKILKQIKKFNFFG